MTVPVCTLAELATLVCDQMTEFFTDAFSSMWTSGPITELTISTPGLMTQFFPIDSARLHFSPPGFSVPDKTSDTDASGEQKILESEVYLTFRHSVRIFELI